MDPFKEIGISLNPRMCHLRICLNSFSFFFCGDIIKYQWKFLRLRSEANLSSRSALSDWNFDKRIGYPDRILLNRYPLKYPVNIVDAIFLIRRKTKNGNIYWDFFHYDIIIAKKKIPSINGLMESYCLEFECNMV